MSRPIDADKLAGKATYMYGFGENKYVPEKAIKAAPTITYEDLVPHGRWEITVSPLTKCKKITCSECGHRKDRGPAWDISWGLPDWCEGCGRRMDGGKVI